MENYIQLRDLLNIDQTFNKWNGLYNHFIQIIDLQMEQESIVGHTLFSQISYLARKYKWSYSLKSAAHEVRTKSKRINADNPPTEADLQNCQYLITQLIHDHTGLVIPKDLECTYSSSSINKLAEIDQYVPDQRLLIVNETSPGLLEAISETSTDQQITINLQYLGVQDQTVLYELVRLVGILPLTVHLHDIHVKESIWYPKMIVLQPDFLIDITGISECFKPEGIIADTYVLRKLYSGPKTHHLLIGNIANYFLDEIVKRPEVKFEELMPMVFQLFPLDWIKYNDDQVRDIVRTIKTHFVHLHHAVTKDFEELKLVKENIFLEPSFYSNKYGIQGRLDIFYKDNIKGEAKIIELKSGSAYKPNAYGLSGNHYAQTLLYDLLIKSVFEGVKPLNYILYSKLHLDRLKYAPVIKEQQRKAMRIRNRIILREYQLAQLEEYEDLGPIMHLEPQTFPIQSGFISRDLQAFFSSIKSGSGLDQSYYKAFVGFIAREQHLSKLGLPGRNKRRGISSLWLDSLSEKQNQYEIISGLKYESTINNDDTPIVRMKRGQGNEQLANFRVGDIAVLYPNNNGINSVLHNQVFKCSILELSEEHVTLRFRNSQLLLDYLVNENEWLLEHDILDSGLNHMYKSLHSFLATNERFRSLIYGQRAPTQNRKIELEGDQHIFNQLSTLQLKIIGDMIKSEEYYLLWGPPGTGKTSIMLRIFVQYLIQNTEERVLLLAYTNRAVDEICAAMVDAGLGEKYLRIGSRHSSSTAYKGRLLNVHCKVAKSRKMLTDLLKETRIYVSTVASIMGRSELLKTIPFDTVIIDEASQILEPNLVGLLKYFKRFVFIGDHHQLPAVVRQSNKKSKTNDPKLHEIGLEQLNVSLFERLIKIAQSNNWHHAFGQLTHQGRMHQDIMKLASKLFYNDQLEIVSSLKRLSHKNSLTSNPKVVDQLISHRCLFVPTNIDSKSITGKTNLSEATAIVKILKLIQPSSKLKSINQSIGIITPFRAQIALINNMLIKESIEQDNITIDTVERYQGSARDLIFLSLCTNSSNQLKMIGGQSISGMNKKFNVSLTRAKEQIIVLGNEEILKGDKAYEYYIKEAVRVKLG